MFLSDRLKGVVAPSTASKAAAADAAESASERRKDRALFAAGVRLHIGHVDDLRADKKRAWTFAVAAACLAVLVLAAAVPLVIYLATLPRERAVIVERDPVTHDLHFAGGLIDDSGRVGAATTPLAIDRDPAQRDAVRRAIARWIEDHYSTPNDTIALQHAKDRIYAATADGSQALNEVNAFYRSKATNPFDVARTVRNDVRVADVSAYGSNTYRVSWYVQAYDATSGKSLRPPALFTDPRVTVVVQRGVADKSLNEAEIFVTHFMPQAEVQ